jgi:plasmid stabilization system protein ParE
MATIELAPELGEDIERMLHHFKQFEVEDATERIQQILEAIAVLRHNPLIGRPVDIQEGISESPESALRELVIGRRARGHVALYRYVPELDIVFVLALRGQREAGYLKIG